MSSVSQTFTNLIAWLAVRAGAKIGASRPSRASLAIAAPATIVLGQAVEPNRAGRLVPVPEEALEPEVGRSLGAHWALWAAVVLILTLLAVGYLRRRWKAGSARPAWFSWLSWGRDESRK